MATNKKSTSPVQALADARALLDQREADQQAAVTANEELRDQLSAGDDKVTALELAAAYFQIQRAELLVPAAKSAVQRAERAVELFQAQTSPTLAEWLHQLIQKDPFAFGLQGMPISVVPELPRDAEGPAAFLSQLKPTTLEPSTGAMSGTVWLDLVLPEYVEAWDYTVVDRAVKRLIDDGGLAERAYVNARQQLRAPKLAIDIVKLQPEIPSLPLEAPESALRDFGWLVSDSIHAAGDKITHNADDPRYRVPGSSISASVKACDLVDLSNDAGIVRRQVSVTLHVAGRHTSTELAARIAMAVENLPGKIAPWLGRIDSGSVAKYEWAEQKRPDQVGRVKVEKSTVRVDFTLLSAILG
ncbi:hypothetical protein ACQPZX_02725 [Actinoplanes sp. CA-142083]|uniref:hypothetical protein n=1 Tax=Actinoplanes sp. CA-142083 TaxID=3239903 RepID=UPI003D8EB26F